MADAIELRMNKASIKRVDPYVKEILETATHVALYKFNTTSCEWEKTETEGALFIYSRNGEPFHSFMVMNRLNTDNVIEPIVKDFDCQMQNPFLLYRNSKSKIFGIWFFTREECVKITYLIEAIMESLKSESCDNKLKKDSGGSGANGVNIFNLLSKAQEDFNKTPTKQPQTDEIRSPPAFSTPRDGTSKSVMDFFAKASTKSTQKAIPLGGDGGNVLQRLMSNPAHSVEHIEKQQRSITPQEQIPPHQKQHSDRRSVPISFPSTSVVTSKDTESRLNFMGVSPPQLQGSSPLAFLLQGPQAQDESVNTRTSPFAQFLDNAQKPQLMTPMMFMTTDNKSQSAVKTTENIDLLTEKQLAQALIHLLKTNSNFTRQIHEAYVSSIMEKVNSSSTGNSLI